MSSLTVIRGGVVVSLIALIASMAVADHSLAARDFLVGLAVGMLLAISAALFNLHSVTTKDEVRERDSEIQTLRLG